MADVSGYGYTGEWWESEVGLLHLRARWYLPETGTFLSRYPLFSTSEYQYTHGNPINWTDPSGYCIPDYDCPNAEEFISLKESKYWYSEQYGWFDRAHLNFANPKTVLRNVKLNRSGGTFFVDDSVGEGAYAFLFRAEYEILKPLTDEQINGVTLGILQDFSIEFEHAQLSTQPIAGDGAISTWFAIEDLPSNQIGFIAANLPGVSVEMILFGKLDARPHGKEPPHSGIYPDPSRNFEFKPLIPDSNGGYEHIDFPTECQLQPIDDTSGLWRRNITQAATGASPRWEEWPDGLLLPLSDPRSWQEVQDAIGYIEGVQE